MRSNPICRREFLCGLGALAAAPARAAHRKPNFIVLFADDLGYGDLGCYGSQTIRTPNLDRMAGQGVRFTNFYAGAPFCSPSRASMLTGRYPVRAGVPNVLFPTEKTGLPPEEMTFAELLKPQGYRTGCVGKWHLGNEPIFRAHRQGFDFFYGLPYANDCRKQLPGEPFRPVLAPDELPLMENDKVIEAPVDQHTLTERYTQRALRFIRESRDNPFVLYLAYTAPHTPIYAATEREGKSPAGLYADTVEEVDASAGRVLDTLRELKLDRDTLVLFTSDNGPRRSGKDPREGGGSTAGLRGVKGLTWEGGMRVPGIFWWPGQSKPGGERSDPASVLDVFPTMAKLAGAQLPRDRVIDGASLDGVLTGTAPLKDRLFCYYFGAQLQAVRLGRWKLILKIDAYPPKPPSIWYKDEKIFRAHYRLMPQPQLFDLVADPDEKTDVAASHPDIVKDLAQRAQSFDAAMQRDKRPQLYL
ncbi:MAG: sulfatase [Acidobacteria bacterium]|nr:sulfatase [Acidobacteriota bacterium]